MALGGMNVAARLSHPASRRGLHLSATNRNLITGLLFISPWIIGLLAFTAYPILASLYYSFTRYTVIDAPEFIGLDN
jgi:multiple sugar transport system permease protein